MFARISLLVTVLLVACTVPTPVIDKVDPCAKDQVDCDSHGTCAVEGGTNAVCLCQAGYRAEGTHCVAVVAGNECQGVTCSSHGNCVVVDGSPKTPLCLCATGYHSAGATTCVADPADPCADQTCSGHGSCAVENDTTPVCICESGYSALGTMCVATSSANPCTGQVCSNHGTCAVANGTTAVCVCDPGYSASGLSCTAPSSFDGGASGLLIVPGSIAWGRTGRYASYTKISPSDAGSTTFDLGALTLRDLQTGTERVLDAAPPILCGAGGCALGKTVVFDDKDVRAIATSPRVTNDMSNYSPGEVIEVNTGAKTPMTSLTWVERPLQYSKDLSWVVVGRLTYLGNGGAIEWQATPTSPVQNVGSTCNDPSTNSVDAMADGASTKIAYWSCAQGANNTVTWSLSVTTMPGKSTTAVTSIVDANFYSFLATYLADGYIWYSTSTGTSYVAISPSATPVSLGAGSLSNRSPNGRFALVGDFNSQALVDLTSPTTAKVVLGPLKRGDWRGPDTFIFKKADGTVWASTAGAAPVQLVAAGVVSDAFNATANGFIDNVATGGGQIFATVRNSTASFNFQVPADARRTFYNSQGAAQSLGAWTYWSNGPSVSMRGHFYFDVLRGSVPDPANGFSFVPTP